MRIVSSFWPNKGGDTWELWLWTTWRTEFRNLSGITRFHPGTNNDKTATLNCVHIICHQQNIQSGVKNSSERDFPGKVEDKKSNPGSQNFRKPPRRKHFPGDNIFADHKDFRMNLAKTCDLVSNIGDSSRQRICDCPSLLCYRIYGGTFDVSLLVVACFYDGTGNTQGLRLGYSGVQQLHPRYWWWWRCFRLKWRSKTFTASFQCAQTRNLHVDISSYFNSLESLQGNAPSPS